MNEELKRKLYNYEAEPPEIMWSRIVATLDQEINAEFPQKLYTLETPPPFDAWNRIEEKLEEDIQEQYPTKLYNLEIAPPPAPSVIRMRSPGLVLFPLIFIIYKSIILLRNGIKF